MISEHLKEHIKVIQETSYTYEDAINSVAFECIKRIESNGKIIIFGNGGSAADAQHMAAELVGNFNYKDRKPLPAIALTTDTSAITSISNDYTYDKVFSRQLEAFASDKDIVIGISTSGTSKNVINALEFAKKRGCFVVGLTGNSGGKMNAVCDRNIIVSSNHTSRIQEAHIFIIHCICDSIDKHFYTTKQ